MAADYGWVLALTNESDPECMTRHRWDAVPWSFQDTDIPVFLEMRPQAICRYAAVSTYMQMV